jgi:AraC-like DNA-binding protein
LTRVIEEISHKPAKRWIDDYIVLKAKMMLRSTPKTIQEISDELNFPDMSFFWEVLQTNDRDVTQDLQAK